MASTAPHTPAGEEIALAPGVALRRIARRFLPYARPLRWWIALGLLLVVAVPLVEAAKIWLFKLVIDDVLVPQQLAPLKWLAIAFVSLTLIGGALSAADDTVSTWVGERFILGIRLDAFNHLHRISLVSLGRRKLGDLLSRLGGDVGAIESFVVGGLTDMVAFGAELAFFTAALFILKWDLALISLVVVPLFWYAARRFSDLIRSASRERRRRSGTIGALAEESLANAQLVQVYDRHDHQAERYRAESTANLHATMRATRLQAVFTPLVDLIEVLGALLVVGVGAWMLSKGRISIGALLVFLTYLSQLYGPVRGLSKLATSLHSAAAGAERVIEILDEPAAVAGPAVGVQPTTLRGELRLDRVRFRYGDELDALSGVSCTFEPGRLNVVAGPNGAGKSTLARLLLRLEDPTDGRVLLDGIDLRELDLAWLRAQMAVVLQEGGILDASVRDNIAFGKLDASDDEIVAAAITAGVHGVIAALPDGYDTRVGARGARLSGGQRQRIALARALVRNAAIVVLDEPTNHLDDTGGADLIAAIRDIARTRTVIVISHDPALIEAAETVLTLGAGRIQSRARRSSPGPPTPAVATA